MWYEFQSKGSQSTVFELKHPKQNTSLMDLNKKVVVFNDGQRIIGKVLSQKNMNNIYYWEIEDIDGYKTTINSKGFHKITSHKNFSKRFIQFKIDKHIVD
jgi:hypothetical protein